MQNNDDDDASVSLQLPLLYE